VHFAYCIKVGRVYASDGVARAQTLNKTNASLKTFLLKIPMLPEVIFLSAFYRAIFFFVCRSCLPTERGRKIAGCACIAK
jgi:hypothetical protein